MRDHRLRAEKAEPIDPTDPIDSTEPKEFTEPMDSAEPTDPIDSTENFEPMDSSDPSDRHDHFDAATFILRRYRTWRRAARAGCPSFLRCATAQVPEGGSG